METIKLLLFERPMALYVALFFAEAICLLVWWRVRSRPALVAAIVPLILAGALVAMSTGIETEHERLVGALHSLQAAIVAGDGRAAGEWIDDAYDDRQYQKAAAIAAVQNLGGTIQDVTFDQDSPKAIIEDGQAQMPDVRATVFARTPVGSGIIKTQWQLWWVRRPEGWRLSSSKLVGSSFSVTLAPKGPR